MKIPSVKDAHHLLSDAEKRNPGPWIQHSIIVAKAAKAIATFHSDIDPNISYVLGLLHDIGRQEGVSSLRHILDGYWFLNNLGFDDAARICLTHSFPTKDINVVAGTWDCTINHVDFVEKYLSRIDYTSYDKLILLCDSIALPSGFCLLEKRLLDVALRYGVNEYTLHKWRATVKIRDDFEAALGQSIYHLLPGVVENTFGFNILSHTYIETN